MAKHGAYDFEHESNQPFNVTIRVEIDKNEINDDLSKTVNYADLQKTIEKNLYESSIPNAKILLSDIAFKSQKFEYSYDLLKDPS